MAALWYDPTFCLFFYGGILVALAVLNRLAAQLSDAEILGAALALLWVAEQTIRGLLPQPPDPAWMLGILDLSGWLVVRYCLRIGRRPLWKRFLGWTFVAGLVLLTADAALRMLAPSLMAKSGPGELSLADSFDLGRNLIFFAQVASVGCEGGRRAGIALGRLLSHRDDRRHHLGAHS